MPRPSSRFALVDALRGVAALAVVLYHAYVLDVRPHATASLIEPFHSILAYGYLGVYVFFVLSGFVIAHSVRDATITPGFVARFALRRSLRLDPPYWVAIGLAIVVAAYAPVERAPPLPPPGAVVAHLFYAQQFVGVPHIIGVFWTLCLEIQFYLAYILLMAAVQHVARNRAWWVFGPFWVLSLLVTVEIIRWGHALFVWAWPYFFLGALTAWHFHSRITTRAWLAIATTTCVVLAWSHSRWLTANDAPERVGVAATTALALFLAGRARRGERSLLHIITLGRPLQYLGRISYSLYLTHVLASSLTARLALRLLGDDPLGTGGLIAMLLACTATSVAFAHIIHVVVERPSLRLAQRVALARPT